jgi:hypothetical protein
MIKLNKSSAPATLIANAQQWTQELLTYHEQNIDPPASLINKYKSESVKETLKVDTYSKCMYCESYVEHVSYEHIEHIKRM